MVHKLQICFIFIISFQTKVVGRRIIKCVKELPKVRKEFPGRTKQGKVNFTQINDLLYINYLKFRRKQQARKDY